MSTACSCLIFLCLSLNVYQIAAQSGKRCTTPNGEIARCISIYSCDVLYDAVTTRDPDTVRFLRASQCGYDEAPLVCCGSSSTYVNVAPPPRTPPPTKNQLNRLVPGRDTCGIQVSQNKILNGQTAGLDEFPWMALLEYRNSSGYKSFSCGGSLINSKYILTAAHCVTGRILTKSGNLISVRLGEWNTDTETDCIDSFGFKSCSDPPVNIEVEKTVPHAAYNDNSRDRYHDIALVRLKRPVSYTDYIRPVCLPLDSSEKARIGDRLEVAGWGRTENSKYSPTKQKLQVPVVGLSDCRGTFRRSHVNLQETQMCAGGERDKDSCSGDSGGPLLNTVESQQSQYYLEGIVSFGAKCGTEGWPGVYTRVSEYLDWIEFNMAQ